MNYVQINKCRKKFKTKLWLCSFEFIHLIKYSIILWIVDNIAKRKEVGLDKVTSTFSPFPFD